MIQTIQRRKAWENMGKFEKMKKIDTMDTIEHMEKIEKMKQAKKIEQIEQIKKSNKMESKSRKQNAQESGIIKGGIFEDGTFRNKKLNKKQGITGATNKSEARVVDKKSKYKKESTKWNNSKGGNADEKKTNSKSGAESKKTGIKKCSVDNLCGGCQYQGVPYREQLKKKQVIVENLFKGYCQVQPIVGMENPLNYRNKVHAVIGEDRDHKIISGTYQAGSHFIVPVENCMLEDEKADAIIATLRTLFKSFKYKPYDEDKRTGLIRHVLIKRGFATNQIMVVLVTASQIVPGKNNFIEALRKEYPEITTIVQNINDRSTSMVLGEKENIWFGKGYIEDELCGLTFKISSKSFYQINPVQTKHLYNAAIKMAKLNGNETIIDAYCGIGTIALLAAEHAKKVIGVELNKESVKDAISNAKRNKILNCEFHQKDAGKFMAEMSLDVETNAADVVIMDPPRSGSTEEFLFALVQLKPKKVIYISCNPETQVRDIKYLEKRGYKALECRPFDMFPYTDHVETVTLLERKI